MRIRILIRFIVIAAMAAGPLCTAALAEKMDIFAGHFSREGNDQSPAKNTEHNIYIKFFEDQWVATLYIPFQYSRSLDSTTIDKALTEARKQTDSPAYIRDTFGHLQERAIATIEKFGYAEDRILFECNSVSPCSVELKDGFLELIKPGMINEHIIKYNHVTDP